MTRRTTITIARAAETMTVPGKHNAGDNSYLVNDLKRTKAGHMLKGGTHVKERDQYMPRSQWESSKISNTEAQTLVTSNGWSLDQRASKTRGAPVYRGPAGQLLLIGFIKSDRSILITSGAEAYLDNLYDPPRPITVVGGFYLEPPAFVRKLPGNARVEIEPDHDPEHSMANRPRRDVEPDGETFLEILVAIGNRIAEIDASFYWRVRTSEGIMTSIDLVNESEAIAIDASVYKQVWDKLSKPSLKRIDVDSYAHLYLRFGRRQR